MLFSTSAIAKIRLKNLNYSYNKINADAKMIPRDFALLQKSLFSAVFIVHLREGKKSIKIQTTV